VGRLEDFKKLKEAAAGKLAEENLTFNLGKAAGDAVVGVSGLIQGAEAVADRSGFINKNGDLSKLKLATAALRPGKLRGRFSMQPLTRSVRVASSARMRRSTRTAHGRRSRRAAAARSQQRHRRHSVAYLLAGIHGPTGVA
jgi:hypothetical protein